MDYIYLFPILIFSIVFHECAHGLAALRAGDPTAKYAGRITLNPVPHIDLIGSVLVPILLIISGSSILIGWAKPVPVNPYNFRNPGRDNMVVSAAGPLSNLVLALGFTFLMIFLGILSGHPLGSNSVLWMFSQYGIQINVVLAVFNLIPVPPLDGSHILRYYLPPQGQAFYDRLRPYGFIILILFLMSPLVRIIYIPMNLLMNFFYSIVRLFL
ncbi:site-2 protease family protein [candidate division KSB1 bacterium]|nr:site-2 protease family protein [candidate division KSB1 bacterium]